MFTGIVEEVATITKITKEQTLTKISVESSLAFKEANVSDSVSINGVCLTLVQKKKNLLSFEAINPTLKTTNLKNIKKGDKVNLEQALIPTKRLGGHFVLGHVDTTLKIRRITSFGKYWQIEIEYGSPFKKFLIKNGSIAIEGISLTIKQVNISTFTLDVIPFTFNNTNLKFKRCGSLVNVEFDYLLKRN